MSHFRWLKAYPALLRAYWARALEYRGQTVIWILASILPLIMMMVWLTISEQQGRPIGGYDRVAFISYFLAVIFMRRMTGVWIIWDLDRDIRQGTLSPQLLRPLDPAHNHLARILALRPFQAILIGPPVIIASLLLGAQYDLSPMSLFFVLVTAFGGTLIEFLAQLLIGALAFWMTQALAIAEAWLLLRAFFSGWIIPIDLFPAAVSAALFYLPFRYMLSLPTEILLGRLSLLEILQGLGMQCGWVIGLFIVYRLLWLRGLKHYGAVGA